MFEWLFWLLVFVVKCWLGDEMEIINVLVLLIFWVMRLILLVVVRVIWLDCGFDLVWVRMLLLIILLESDMRKNLVLMRNVCERFVVSGVLYFCGMLDVLMRKRFIW